MRQRQGPAPRRLKTLFDALSVPTETGQFGGNNNPQADEQPFFCLLENDSLVSQIAVETDLSLEKISGGFDDNVARLVITVTVKPYFTTWNTIGL